MILHHVKYQNTNALRNVAGLISLTVSGDLDYKQSVFSSQNDPLPICRETQCV